MTRSVLYRWLPALLWVAVIYTTIPFVRRLRELFVARWPAELIGYAVMAVVVVGAGAAIVALRRRKNRLHFADVAWLLGVAAVLVVWTHHLMGQPEEAIHFLEYGVLGALLYRALRTQIPDATVFIAAALIGAMVGTVDEIIQWVVPDRFWDFRDIVLNAGAGVLAQVAIWRLVPKPETPVGRRSLRPLCRLAAAQVLLLTLCLAATPQRIARLVPHLPGLANAASGTDATCEYGHRHALDDLTEYRSRLELAELANTDAVRAAEVAALLDSSRGAYHDFLRDISPVVDPFAYEARVHLFARDRNLAEARQQAPGSDAHRERMTTAFRENLILERAFGATLARSSFAWRPRMRRQTAEAQDPDLHFVSRVGAHLITAISESALRALMLTLLAALLVCDLRLARRPVTPPRPEQLRE